MRGSPHGECPRIKSLSADCLADASSPADASATRRSATARSARSARSQAAQHAQDLQDKPILAPPMFIFQRMTPPMKRSAEDEGSGVGVSKRIRSITYPSLLSRSRKGSCDGSRRVRSLSLSFPSPLPAAPCVRVKSTSLRPTSAELGLDANRNLSRVLTEFPSSADALEQRMLPHSSRSYSATNSASAESFQFVFGENMSERVLKKPSREDESETDSSSDSDSSSIEETNKMTVQRTLWESAAAYTASSRHRCVLKQVQVITGEENESNVVQLMCKLFVLERGSQSWSERGRGILRLNDLESRNKGCLQSRIIMRNQGSLKLILNTKLYPHTHLRRLARRNLQVMATDLESHSVRVFLIQANARDVARLYVAIHHRLVALRCSAAAFREKEGLNTSEEEREDISEEEEMVLVTHKRSGDYSKKKSYSTICL